MNFSRIGSVFIVLTVFTISAAGCGVEDLSEAVTDGTAVHSISGKVDGALTAGIAIRLSGAADLTTNSDSAGNYVFSSITDGSYTIMPSLTGYTFSPSSLTVTLNGRNITNANFTASAVDAPTYGISGTVSGTVLEGVTISLSGDASATTTTDASGNYSLNGLANGSYTLTPALAGYIFNPATMDVTISGSSATGRNFAASASPVSTFEITGTVSGAVLEGVTISLSGEAAATTITDASGNYSLSGLANGNYTLAPALAGYIFNPATMDVTISGSSATGRNFTAAASPVSTFGIAGTVSGAVLEGVTISLSGDAAATTTTDASGNYSFSGLANGSYTLAPALAGYIFNPATMAVTISGSSATGRNFTASASPASTFEIAGTVSGAVLQGVTITLEGSANATTATDTNGNYSFSGLENGSYTISPASPGALFVSASTAVTLSGTNVTGVNFAAMEHAGPTFSISGSVSGDVQQGVKIGLSGTTCATTTTDAAGNYLFAGLAAGSYTVWPVTCSYLVSPNSSSVTLDSTNVTDANFSLTAGSGCSGSGIVVAEKNISGTVTGVIRQGVTVILTGQECAATTTDAEGNFMFAGYFQNGDYIVTPALVGHTFNPTARAITFNFSDVNGADFTAY